MQDRRNKMRFTMLCMQIFVPTNSLCKPDVLIMSFQSTNESACTKSLNAYAALTNPASKRFFGCLYGVTWKVDDEGNFVTGELFTQYTGTIEITLAKIENVQAVVKISS